MIRLSLPIPKSVYLMLSGGPDSVGALGFLLRGRRNVHAIHVNHETAHASAAEKHVRELCEANNIPLTVFHLSDYIVEDDMSQGNEAAWRNVRYRISDSLPEPWPVVTGHHLDDAVEWWLMSSMHGIPRMIPKQRNRYIRPFITTRRSNLIRVCHDMNFKYIDDPTNLSLDNVRGRIRLRVLPEVLRINPGIHTVLRKRYERNLDMFPETSACTSEKA